MVCQARIGTARACMGVSDMTPELKALIESASSAASRKAMIFDLKVYETWAKQWGPAEPLPATPEMVAEFIAAMGPTRAVSTVTRYVSSLSRIHDRSGWENPTKTPIVRDALTGLRRTKYTSPVQSPALSGRQLIDIISGLSQTEWASQRNRALFSIGWTCALRCSELASLRLEDIDLVYADERDDPQSPCSVVVHIRKGKTDQEGTGKSMGIPVSPLASIVQRWVGMLVSLYLDTTGPLFPRFSRSSKDRYFPRTGKRPGLSTRGISKTIRQIMLAHSFNGSVHSLRRGMITEAARCDVPESIIMRHSRHRSSRNLRTYIEAGNLFTDNPLPAIFSRLFSGSSQDSKLGRV